MSRVQPRVYQPALDHAEIQDYINDPENHIFEVLFRYEPVKHSLAQSHKSRIKVQETRELYNSVKVTHPPITTPLSSCSPYWKQLHTDFETYFRANKLNIQSVNSSLTQIQCRPRFTQPTEFDYLRSIALNKDDSTLSGCFYYYNEHQNLILFAIPDILTAQKRLDGKYGMFLPFVFMQDELEVAHSAADEQIKRRSFLKSIQYRNIHYAVYPFIIRDDDQLVPIFSWREMTTDQANVFESFDSAFRMKLTDHYTKEYQTKIENYDILKIDIQSIKNNISKMTELHNFLSHTSHSQSRSLPFGPSNIKKWQKLKNDANRKNIFNCLLGSLQLQQHKEYLSNYFCAYVEHPKPYDQYLSFEYEFVNPFSKTIQDPWRFFNVMLLRQLINRIQITNGKYCNITKDVFVNTNVFQTYYSQWVITQDQYIFVQQLKQNGLTCEDMFKILDCFKFTLLIEAYNNLFNNTITNTTECIPDAPDVLTMLNTIYKKVFNVGESALSITLVVALFKQNMKDIDTIHQRFVYIYLSLLHTNTEPTLALGANENYERFVCDARQLFVNKSIIEFVEINKKDIRCAETIDLSYEEKLDVYYWWYIHQEHNSCMHRRDFTRRRKGGCVRSSVKKRRKKLLLSNKKHKKQKTRKTRRGGVFPIDPLSRAISSSNCEGSASFSDISQKNYLVKRVYGSYIHKISVVVLDTETQDECVLHINTIQGRRSSQLYKCPQTIYRAGENRYGFIKFKTPEINAIHIRDVTKFVQQCNMYNSSIDNFITKGVADGTYNPLHTFGIHPDGKLHNKTPVYMRQLFFGTQNIWNILCDAGIEDKNTHRVLMTMFPITDDRGMVVIPCERTSLKTELEVKEYINTSQKTSSKQPTQNFYVEKMGWVIPKEYRELYWRSPIGDILPMICFNKYICAIDNDTNTYIEETLRSPVSAQNNVLLGAQFTQDHIKSIHKIHSTLNRICCFSGFHPNSCAMHMVSGTNVPHFRIETVDITMKSSVNDKVQRAKKAIEYIHSSQTTFNCKELIGYSCSFTESLSKLDLPANEHYFDGFFLSY